METVERGRKAAVYRRGQTFKSSAYEGASGLQVPTPSQTQAEHGQQNGGLFVPDALLTWRYEPASSRSRRRTRHPLLAIGRPARRFRSSRQREFNFIGHDDHHQQHDGRQFVVICFICCVGDSFARLGQEPLVWIPFAVRLPPASLLRHGWTSRNARIGRIGRTSQSQRK